MIVGIDPGGGYDPDGNLQAHVGWAVFGTELGGGWYCAEAIELTPDGACDALVVLCNGLNLNRVVCESWRLFPEQAARHVGSDFPAVQLIGRFKQIVYMGNVKRRKLGQPEVAWTEQPPSIKKPTLSLLRKRGIDSRAVTDGHGGHAKDAEVHVWHHLLRPQRAEQVNRRMR